MEDPIDPGSFDPVADAEAYPADGVLHLTLTGALEREGRPHDLVCRLRRRDHRWDRDGLGQARTFNGEDHPFRARREAEGQRWRCTGTIRPDAWVVIGGPFDLTIDLDANRSAGRYAGVVAGRTVAGAVRAAFVPRRPASRGVGRPALRILAEGRQRLWNFSRAGLAGGAPVTVDPALPVFAATDFGVGRRFRARMRPGPARRHRRRRRGRRRGGATAGRRPRLPRRRLAAADRHPPSAHRHPRRRQRP